MKLLGCQSAGIISSVEPGCERFDVYQSEEEPELFLLIEVWASEAHLAQHGSGSFYAIVPAEGAAIGAP